MTGTLFDDRKAAHAAAFFLHRAGGQLQVLKLMKLLYLAEREAYRRYGEPMLGDWPVSMEHGPVLSRTLNHINAAVAASPGGWDYWIEDREQHMVRLARPVDDEREQLDRLSDAEAAILQSVWDKFGGWTQWQLRDWTHDHCSEWRDPNGSMIPIPSTDLLQAVGYSEDQARALADRLREHERAKKALTSQ